MTLSVLSPFDETASAWRETAEETARTLTAAELAIFPDLCHDATELRSALFKAYSEPELSGSLLATDVFGLDRHLFELYHHTFAGLYESARRTLRCLWERAFRSHFADLAHFGGAGATLDEKVDWLEAERLNWPKCIVPVLSVLFRPADSGSAADHFKTIWDRLNQVVHPSAPMRFSEMRESERFVWPHFDADLCRQLLADVNQVLALMWLLVLCQFPKVRGTIADPALVFNSFPVLKTFLD